MVRGKKLSCRKSTKAFEEVRRHWGDVEVVDAEQDLLVFVQPEDVAAATRKDPGCCVFAQACKRQFKSTKVVIWKSVGYVDIPGPTGVSRVERFLISPGMRELIENFDRGKAVPESGRFLLKRPRPSNTFEGELAKSKRKREQRRMAIVSGTISGSGASSGRKGKGRFSKPAIVVDLEVRSGQGRVQFRKSASKS
jgi:hypothetical protein